MPKSRGRTSRRPPQAAPPRRAPSKKPAPEPRGPDEAEDPDDIADAEDFMMGDGQAAKRIQEQEEARANRVREFYVRKADVDASPTGNVECRVHCLVNYAERDGENYINIVSAPRVQIPQERGFRIFTSPDNGDCAFREAGLNPGIRPCFIIQDHRQFKARDGRTFQDDIKQFNPPGKCIAMMKAAIRDLCENLDVDPDDPDEVNEYVDVRDHVLKITKLGSGRGSGWSFSFVVKPCPPTEEQLKRIANFFGKPEDDPYPDRKEYIAKMKKILSPDPKYLLSKGGKYVKPTRPATDPNAGGSDEEVPY